MNIHVHQCIPLIEDLVDTDLPVSHNEVEEASGGSEATEKSETKEEAEDTYVEDQRSIVEEG